MSSGENKQRLIFSKLQKDKKQAYDLLLKRHLLKEDNDLIIQGPVITSANEYFEFVKANGIPDFYSKNASCFIFKLIDESIFNIYVLTNKEGVIIKSSFSYCSCPCFRDILIEEQGDYYFDKNKELDENDNQAKISFDDELRNFFASKCKGDSKLIHSLIDLAKNPLYIRCDFDPECASEMHPEYHLTINFIKESRFRIDLSFSFFDFVSFILDLVYGKKNEHPLQFIHISQF